MKKGFTLIELMVVVAIIAILSSIAINRVNTLVMKSREAKTKGDLVALRSTLRIYYVDTVGFYPDSIFTLVTRPVMVQPIVSVVPTSHSSLAIGSVTFTTALISK